MEFVTLSQEQFAVLKLLDYRAHRLFWLLWLPFRAIFKLSLYGTLLAAIVLALSISFGTPAKMLIAYFAWELLALFLVGFFVFYS